MITNVKPIFMKMLPSNKKNDNIKINIDNGKIIFKYTYLLPRGL